MTRVLVTGARGFVGRQIVTALARRGADVHAITTSAPDPGLPVARWHRADLMDPVATRAAIEAASPTHLVHAAWETGHGTFWHADANYDWVAASLQLARDFIRVGGRRLVGVGSCAEYEWGHGLCREDATPLRPVYPYGACKLALSQLWRTLAETNGRSFAWGRLFHLYGPYEKPDRFVSSMIRALLHEAEAPCTAGDQTRDFMDARDAGEAIAVVALGHQNGAVNIGSGVPVQLRTIAAEIGRIAGRPDLVRLGAIATRPDDPSVLVPDTGLLQEAFGFRSSYSLTDGLSEAVEWWRAAENGRGVTARPSI